MTIAGFSFAPLLCACGRATTAAAALEQALITRYGTLGRVPTPFLLRSDN